MNDFKSIIQKSFSQYSGAVLQSRALVDVRDCLKPSARQIFYSMFQHKLTHDKSFKKTNNAIGQAMVDFYIHGDASCEGVIMRAGQPFAMRYPLVEIEGNGGSILKSGNWAAPRYTASRLSAISKCLFDDIDKETIDEWRDNYEDTQQYPAVLPSKGFYNLVNGTTGIGIGMASSIPQYNLCEINKALETLIKNPDCSFDDIYCAPDFATGAILINESEVKESMKNGNGSACKLRAVIDYDTKENCLVVKELPYGVYTETICHELEEIEQSENNPGIEYHKDLTKTNVIIKIFLGKNINPDRIIRYLYKNTSLQYYVSINFTMLDNGRFPKVFTWKEMLQAHIEHEKIIYRRGFEYDLKKYKNRIHIIDGLFICLAAIEEVVQTIKASQSTTEAKNSLIKKFLLDEEQAKAVLDMKLSRLASLEIKKLQTEKEDILKRIKEIEAILQDTTLFNNELIKGWHEIAKTYGDERRTVIRQIEDHKIDDVENITPEDCIIILTEGGTIKRVPSANYKPQKRNGKGIKTQDDITSMIIRTNTIDSLMVFSDKGRMYRLSVDAIPEGTNTSKGLSVKALVDMSENENPSVIYSIYRDTDAKYVFFVTKNGIIKKTLLEEYVKTHKKTGLAAINILEGDELASVFLVKDEPIIIITEQGQVIKFNSTEVNPIGRVAMGIRGMNLNEGDYVSTALAVRDPNDALALFSEKGLGKKILPNEITAQHRGGKGANFYKTTTSSGKVVSAAMVSDEDNLLIVGKTKSICISAKELPALGRTSIGNQILKGNTIIGVSKI